LKTLHNPLLETESVRTPDAKFCLEVGRIVAGGGWKLFVRLELFFFWPVFTDMIHWSHILTQEAHSA